jgi:two-component system response regulator AtoC
MNTSIRSARATKKPKILLIDDNEAFLELFLCLPQAGEFHITPTPSAEHAVKILGNESFDLIISDIQMPEMTGIQLFTWVQGLYPDIPVILITAFGSTEEAIQAVKRGAFHYFEKPIYDKLDQVWTTVREAVDKREMFKEITLLKKEKVFALKAAPPVIGRSKEIKKVVQSIKEVALLPVTVLISGETGTGKELVARSIHELSDRKSKPFFAVGCNELSPGVLESELFGHEKGAFTGAIEQKKGLFEVAHQSTLFLDEIVDASARFQGKLLRVLESKRFTRVGGTLPLSSDFRIITATNRDIQADVAAGRFRQDLFFRINVYEIKIPPLRHRKEDISLIADFYVKRFCQVYNRSITGLSESALASMIMYDWPGNVRELINVMERAVITCNQSMITTRHLPFGATMDQDMSDLNLKAMEKFIIELSLKRSSYNKTLAAELLGISRKTLIDKVKKYKLEA